MNERIIASVGRKRESFTPKQAERIMSLLEVAAECSEGSNDAKLLERLSRLFN